MSRSRAKRDRLVAVTLDQASFGRALPDIEHERAVAIYDLLEDNSFAVENYDGGPFALTISLAERRLVLAIEEPERGPVVTHILSLAPFRRIVRDYFLICESYYAAIRTGSPSRIEALDHGRRGVHDDGSRLLAERLAGKVALDHDTARRLFTLICVLHWRG